MKILTRICLAIALSVAPGFAALLYGELVITGTVNVSVVAGVTTIDFLPISPGGEVIAGLSNTGAFAPFNTASIAQRTGVIQDLASNAPPLVNNWLSWAGSGIGAPLNTMNVQLVQLLLSTAPLIPGCVGMALNDSCRPEPNSVFTLTRTANGTTVSINGTGNVIHGLDSVAFGLGISTQFGSLPHVVLATALAPGGISNTFSATLNSVPEPATWALALVALGFVGRFRRR